MSLLKMLVFWRGEPLVVISIFDCSDHLSEGGKDTQYIRQLFKGKVAEFDQPSTFTNAFFFNGANNLKKL